MAVTNLLDRIAEDYEGNHPVEYRAPLAKLGKTIGKIDYSLGGGTKGVSARDIIRKDIKGNGVGVYPIDVLEKRRNNKRKDDSMPWDYAIQSKDGGMLIDSFNGGTKADANEYMAQLKANGIVPKDAKLVSNVSSSRQTAQQKRDLDEFKKAFDDVRSQRDEYNSLIDKGDILGHYQDLSSKKTNMKLKGALLSQETDIARKRGDNRIETAARTYGINYWKDFVAAKKASKEAGQNLGRLFAEQNQREKNMYGNISKGLKPSTDAVPEGRYKYALGNQNHVYSASPDEPENDWMNLNPEYHGQPALTNSGHEIHWRKDGTPIIDAFTWTQIPNIEKIKKTGYLATEGSDTKKYHPGTEGQWTAEVDNYPMDENHDNHVEIFKRGKNGETFNEELLHSRLPLNWFQRQPVTHQGPRGWGVKVDVIHAKPGSPEVFWGEGEKRRSAQVATPAQFINHIPEDKMRKDWAPVWKKNMLPGSHPNKEDLGETGEFIFGMTGRDPSGSSVEEQKKAASMMANKDSYALQYVLRNVDKSDKTALQRDADKAFLEDYVKRTSGNRTPYSLAWNTKNLPKQGKGAVDRGGGNGIFDFGDWKNADRQYEPLTSQYPRTMEYLENKVLDEMSLGGLARNSSKPLLNDALAEIPYGEDRMSLHSNLRNEYPSEFSKRTNDRTGINDVERYRSEKPFLNDIGFIVQRQGRKKTGFDELALSRAENDIYHNPQKYIGNTSKEKARKALDEAYKDMLEDDYQKFGKDAWKAYYKADSLDKVIGHMIGRRIGADRAKRGKKIF